MKTFFYILIIIISLTTNAFNQSQNTISATWKDGVIVIEYSIQKGQTIYGLSQHFGGDVAQTIDLNPKIDLANVSVQTNLKFSLSPELISQQKDSISNTPVIYTVKKGDTAYNIATQYFDLSVVELLKLNQKTTSTLSQSENLIVGFINLPFYDRSIYTDKIASNNEIKEVIAEAVITNDSTNISISTQIDTIPSPVTETWVKERGLAYWQNNDNGQDELLVMHSKARINTEIELYNPMLDKKVNAKVVAQLPEKSYPDNISIVISPAVADALGALDKRFLVEMTYIQ